MAVANPNKGTGADNPNVRISGVQSGISSLPRKVVRGIGEGLGSLASSIAKTQKENAKRIVDLDQNAAAADVQTLMHKAMVEAHERQDIGYLQNTDKWFSQKRQEIFEQVTGKYNADGKDQRSTRIRIATQNKLNFYDAQIMKMHKENADIAGEQLRTAKSAQIVGNAYQNTNGNDDDLEVASEAFGKIDTYRAADPKSTSEDKIAMGNEVLRTMADKGSDQGLANVGKNILSAMTQAYNNKNPDSKVNELTTIGGEPFDKFIKAQLEVSRRADKARLAEIYKQNGRYISPETFRKALSDIDKKYKEAETRILGAADAEISKFKTKVINALKDVDRRLKYRITPRYNFKKGRDPNYEVKNLYNELVIGIKDTYLGFDPRDTGKQLGVDALNVGIAVKNKDFSSATIGAIKVFIGAFDLVVDAGRIVFQNAVASRWLKDYFTEDQRNEIINTDALSEKQIKEMNFILSLKRSRDRWANATDIQKEAYKYWSRIKRQLYEIDDGKGNKKYRFRHFHQAVRSKPEYARLYERMVRDRIRELDPDSYDDYIEDKKRNSNDTVNSMIALAEENNEWGFAIHNAKKNHGRGVISDQDYDKFKAYLKESSQEVPPEYQSTYESSMKGLSGVLRSMLNQNKKVSPILGAVFENDPRYQEIMYWLRKEAAQEARNLHQESLDGKRPFTHDTYRNYFNKKVRILRDKRYIDIEVLDKNGNTITKRFKVDSVLDSKKKESSGGSKGLVKDKIKTSRAPSSVQTEDRSSMSYLKRLPYIQGVPLVRLNEEYKRLTHKSLNKKLTVFEKMKLTNIDNYLSIKEMEYNAARQELNSAK